MQFNCSENCKYLNRVVKFACSVFAMEPVTDNCLVLDMSMSLVVLNRISPFTNGAPYPL